MCNTCNNTRPHDKEVVYRVKEAANVAKSSSTQIYRWISDGCIDSTLRGRMRFVVAASLHAFLTDQPDKVGSLKAD